VKNESSKQKTTSFTAKMNIFCGNETRTRGKICIVKNANAVKFARIKVLSGNEAYKAEKMFIGPIQTGREMLLLIQKEAGEIVP
jgi:hypothetical protein